ncbi:2-hydroxyacid dehydrogenase [Ruminiclostridium cellobioparum]|uniref:D-isomer specific 2-hydroxyacid dehydrogenase, NAD binding domain protein n=1 Tax=Ruminiclostridium cellobioparum subsp. termitidis CT1112 TaxID=1195236 RepID=S0FXF3_RUMCE|nr:NAD(P)-dependent oxidoreductase [Ruminiclostridium cellobioparum]EMS73819.1 D-isomer specific 2-hydroxyacid dehydrogenase, NAD binding domain protein [Ruminiclostridium cellobioparum subsp. termitidis CT1112]
MNDKTVVLNAGLVNYDGNIDYSQIASEVVIYDETPEDTILERVDGFTIVVTKEMKVSGDIIRKFPDSVKMICEAGTGYNNIDLDAVREKGILLCNIPAYSSKRVAHTAILLILNLASSMQKQIRMLSEGNHDNFHKHLMVDHVELNGKILGVIGYGNIAKEIIKVAQALGMKILVSTRTSRADVEEIHFTTNEEILKKSDFISLNCPLNESTRHMINKETLAMMKPTAYLINTARGALIDEAALIDALQNNVIAGAGLDVQEVEPLKDTSPLYTMDNVIITPHMGWRGLETRQRLVSLIQENISAFSKGQPINIVDQKKSQHAK